MKGQGAVGRQM